MRTDYCGMGVACQVVVLTPIPKCRTIRISLIAYLKSANVCEKVRTMTPVTVNQKRQSKQGLQLARQIQADLRKLPNLSSEKLGKKDEDTFIDTFLDCYQLYRKVQQSLPMPSMLDDENGTILTILEDAEKLLQQCKKSKNVRIARLTPIWLDLIQQFRWLIMINDGVADMRKTDDKIYKSAGAFMASLDHE